MSDMEEVRSSFAKFKQRQEIVAFADNFKMVVVGILVLSVFVFSMVGDENVRPYIWHWAIFMTSLVIACGVMDFRNHLKMKRLGLK